MYHLLGILYVDCPYDLGIRNFSLMEDRSIVERYVILIVGNSRSIVSHRNLMISTPCRHWVQKLSSVRHAHLPNSNTMNGVSLSIFDMDMLNMKNEIWACSPFETESNFKLTRLAEIASLAPHR